eukprot:symbB.v1.2.020616.t1/scaffold1747.1/size103332/3
MLLLLSTTAKHFECLKTATFGLMPRRRLPKEGEAHALFLQIVSGMKELVHLVWEAKSVERSTEALCAAFEGLSQEDGREIATTITSFGLQQEDLGKAAEELMRLTVVFLLNSFASSDNEVRLCRFCALFNHSCDPSAAPETEDGRVGMRLLRPVAAGEEITFSYVPLKQDPSAWPVERRQEFLSKSFGFQCSCHRCVEERVPPMPRSMTGGWQPLVTMHWEEIDRSLLLFLSIDISEVLPLRPEQLLCDLAVEHLRLCAGDQEAVIALPCCCVEAAAAKLARRRLLLTLKEVEGASAGYASSSKKMSSLAASKEEATHCVLGFWHNGRCYNISKSYVLCMSEEERWHRRSLKRKLHFIFMEFCPFTLLVDQVGHCKAFAMSQPDSSRARAKSIGHYILGKTIGEGTFGKVKLGTHILTSERVAVKILEKERIVEVADVERVAREVHILKLIRHPHIVQLYEIIETRRQLYLIMEYASGGELFDYIVGKGRVPELEACRFFHQIIAGLEKVHAMNIVHRDLKPENLLLDEHKNIKIVDFGLSNVFRQGQLLKTACGSPCYAAPEMIAGHSYVPHLCDLWSCGVILFALVCGYLPFEDQNTSALYKKILAADYKTPKFISELLTTDPTRRYNVPDVRAHPWYCQIPEASTPVPDRVEQGEKQDQKLEEDIDELNEYYGHK